VQSVRELSRRGQPLAPDAPTATINNPAWWVDGEPTPARDRLHRRLLEEAREVNPQVERQRRAVVLAGPPGACKSTVLKDVLGQDGSSYRVVDADEFKRSLLREAQADGSYQSWLMPKAVREREAAGERFFPLELAALVHEESSYLARRMRADAIEGGENVVIDAVLSSEGTARELSRTLTSAGYDVSVVDVEVPYEVSQERIRARWEQAHATSLSGGDPFGGRWVPSEYARSVFDGPHGRSWPEAVAEKLAEECPAVSSYRVYRTSEEAEHRAKEKGRGRVSPRLETHMQRPSYGRPLVSTDAAVREKTVRASRPPKPHHRGGNSLES